MTQDEALEYVDKILDIFPDNTKIKDVTFVLIALIQSLEYVEHAEETLGSRWGDK